MSEEVAAPAPEEIPKTIEAPASDDKPEAKAAETPEAKEESKPEKKDGFQKAIDRQTRKYYAEKARADALEAQLRQPNPGSQVPANNPNAEPDRANFADDTEYNRALIRHEATKIAAETIAKSKQAEQAQAVKSIWDKDVEATRKDVEDFDEVLEDFLGSKHLTPAVDRAIMASDRPAAIAAYLGMHEDEAAKISGLSEFRAAIEIGRIEAKLATQGSNVKKVSSAPAPIVPIVAKGAETSIDPEKESPKEFAARRNKEIAARNRR